MWRAKHIIESSTSSLLPELQVDRPGDSNDGSAIGPGGDPRNSAMLRGNAMRLLAGVLLLVGHVAQHWSEDHAGSMHKRQRLVPANAAMFGIVRYARRKGRIQRGGEIKRGGQAAQRRMEIEIGVGGLADGLAVSAFRLCQRPCEKRCRHRDRGDQTEPLVNPQHLSPLRKRGL